MKSCNICKQFEIKEIFEEIQREVSAYNELLIVSWKRKLTKLIKETKMKMILHITPKSILFGSFHWFIKSLKCLKSTKAIILQKEKRVIKETCIIINSIDSFTSKEAKKNSKSIWAYI